MNAPIDMQALADRAAAVRSRVRLSRVIGADVKLRQVGGSEMTGLCPFHGDRRDGAFMVNDDKQLYKCFACGAHGDVINYVMVRKGWTFMRTLRDLEADAGIDFRDAKAKATFDRDEERRLAKQSRDNERRRRSAHNLWLTAAPLRDTPAQRYLEGRGIDFGQLGRLPGAIRYRADVPNKELGRSIPAMLTAIHAPDGRFLAVHRTYLEYREGGWQKARVDKPKMVLGDFYGGFMPLWKGDERKSIAYMSAGLAVAQGEGIEDCLSVAMAEPSFRIIAGISLDNMGNVVLPPQAGDLIFLGQRDGDVRTLRADAARAAGNFEEAEHHEKVRRLIEGSMERAIGKQRARAIEQGATREVRVAWPSPGFKDFNDELRGIRMEGTDA